MGRVSSFIMIILCLVLMMMTLHIDNEQARKLQATLPSPTDLLTGVKCRATSVAKKMMITMIKTMMMMV